MRMKNCALTGLLLSGGTTIMSTPTQAIDLVKDGRPTATIVLPVRTEYDEWMQKQSEVITARVKAANPTVNENQLEAKTKLAMRTELGYWEKNVGDEELLAAEELQSIIEKISGAKLPIARVDNQQLPTGNRVLVGTELARQSGLGAQLDKLDKDGLLIAERPESLVIAGRRARGTLYAAYEVLEDIGCRWVMPGDFGELYPALRTVSINTNKVENPSHVQRYFWTTGGHAPEFPRWTLRNKGNFVRALGDPVVQQSHALAGPLRWGATQDKYSIPGTVQVRQPKKGEKGLSLRDEKGNIVFEVVEKEGTVLPEEYFARREGKINTHLPNLSNPRAWELYADYYIDYFNTRPNEEYVSISAEDGLVIDENPSSLQLRTNDFDWTMGAMSATDALWFFHNRVINRVTKVHPNKKFGVLVYANNLMPPRLEQVHPNMALIFAPLGVCPLHHVRDPKCKTNRAYSVWLQDWMVQANAAGAETHYYDYEPTGFSWNVAMICPRWGIIGKNYPWFKELGLDGHTTQGHDDWASCGLDNYLMQQLYWNADLGYKEVIADYARARFGAAAPVMIEYYDLLEKRMDEIPDLLSNEVWGNHLVLTPEVRKAARAVLSRAEKLAETKTAKAHMATMVDLQRSTDAWCDAVEHARETGEFGRAVQMMETTFEVRDRLNKIYPNFMNAKRTDKSVKAEYLTGGIYNQYLNFDEKIKGAAASVTLPRSWKGILDTGNRAVAMGYHRPEVSVEKLAEQDITLIPDVTYGTQREVAAFFYRTEVTVPQTFAGKKATIYFPSVIAKGLQIWINGQPVEFDYGTYKDTIWRGPDYFWLDYNHEREFDITPLLKPGQKNTVAFRIFKSFDFAGTYRRAFLLAH